MTDNAKRRILRRVLRCSVISLCCRALTLTCMRRRSSRSALYGFVTRNPRIKQASSTCRFQPQFSQPVCTPQSSLLLFIDESVRVWEHPHNFTSWCALRHTQHRSKARNRMFVASCYDDIVSLINALCLTGVLVWHSCRPRWAPHRDSCRARAVSSRHSGTRLVDFDWMRILPELPNFLKRWHQ